MRAGFRTLRVSALGLCALGIVVPVSQAQPPPQSGGLWAPLEPPTTAPYRAPTPQESALLQHLLAQAQGESVGDTDLVPSLDQALSSDNPHVRANAFAMLQIAMLTLRTTPGERASARRAVLTARGWTLVSSGLRDGDGAVRRHALTTAPPWTSTRAGAPS